MVVEVGIRMGTKINVPNMNENIRYIRRYISDISDISDVRHDIDEDQYIVDISVFYRYIVEISGIWYTRVLV